MITEHNQILGSVAHLSMGITKKIEIDDDYISKNFIGFPRKEQNGNLFPYGIGFKKHPCTTWAKTSIENHNWLCELTIEMCKEYTIRYKNIHAGEAIVNWYYKNGPILPSIGMTQFAMAMPDFLKTDNPVHSYRMYYAMYKKDFAKWKTKEPEWWNEYLEKTK
jgi:hypothetical protein